MKKRTFKRMLFSAALLTSIAEVQAQDNPITFTRDMTSLGKNMGGQIVMLLPKWVISTMMESMTCGWTVVGNRKGGRPDLFLPKD